jgi:hypothetical protein
MKIEFPKRKRGQKSIAAKLVAQFDNFFYHLGRGKSFIEAWSVAKKTF